MRSKLSVARDFPRVMAGTSPANVNLLILCGNAYSPWGGGGLVGRKNYISLRISLLCDKAINVTRINRTWRPSQQNEFSLPLFSCMFNNNCNKET